MVLTVFGLQFLSKTKHKGAVTGHIISHHLEPFDQSGPMALKSVMSLHLSEVHFDVGWSTWWSEV